MVAKKAKKRVAKKKVARGPVILPRKMSSLIGIALKDLRKAEAFPEKFIIEMNEWFKVEEAVCRTSDGTEVARHKVCVVCAAGSVMAFTLGALKGDAPELNPNNMGRNQSQLLAINCLREGNVTSAIDALGLDPKDSVYDKLEDMDRSIPEYDPKAPKAFHRAMEKLQADLKKLGC